MNLINYLGFSTFLSGKIKLMCLDFYLCHSLLLYSKLIRDVKMVFKVEDCSYLNVQMSSEYYTKIYCFMKFLVSILDYLFQIFTYISKLPRHFNCQRLLRSIAFLYSSYISSFFIQGQGVLQTYFFQDACLSKYSCILIYSQFQCSSSSSCYKIKDVYRVSTFVYHACHHTGFITISKTFDQPEKLSKRSFSITDYRKFTCHDQQTVQGLPKARKYLRRCFQHQFRNDSLCSYKLG